MINHNEILRAQFNKTIKVNYGGKDWAVNYIEGDIFQVWSVLSHENTKYPLIWLQSGYTVKENDLIGNNKKILEDCNFYLITKGDPYDFNSVRYSDTFKNMLYPLLEKFKKSIAKSKGLAMGTEYEYITFPFNNVSELNEKKGLKANPQSTTTPDIWDAIYLNTTITISEDCYLEFKI